MNDGRLPGGAIAYGFSQRKEPFAHTQGEDRDAYDKRVRDAYRKRQEAERKIKEKGLSMSHVPDKVQ